ncbi:MAG: hypothetical protein ABEK01_03515 [Candidatus Nanohaloarchaea archaeon]
MKPIKFRCNNCGRVKRKDILPLKHAVGNSRRKITRDAECCESPEYEDDQGYGVSSQRQSFAEFIRRA